MSAYKLILDEPKVTEHLFSDASPDWMKPAYPIEEFQFDEAYGKSDTKLKEFEGAKHPRAPKGGRIGKSKGGQFVSVPRTSPRHPGGEEDASLTLTLADLADHPKALSGMLDRMRKVGALPAGVGDDPDPMKAANEAVDWMTANVLDIYRQASAEEVDIYRQWYDAAHHLADIGKHDTTLSGSVAIMATFSASTRWEINVANWQFFMDNVHRLDEPLDEKTCAQANKGREIDIEKTQAAWDRAMEASKKPGGRQVRVPRPESGDVIHFKPGMTPSQMSSRDQAYVMRAYGVGQPDMLILNRDGTITHKPWLKQDGTPWKGAWGTYDMIEKAIACYRTPTYEIIQDAVGDGSKVPSFYNNIMTPDSPAHDVTADTHAFSIALATVLSVKHPWIMTGKSNLYSSPTSAPAGTRGIYVLVAEAYRRACKGTDLLPREMQSVTWEIWRQHHAAASKDKKYGDE